MKFAVIADVHLGNHRRFGGQTMSGLNERFKHCERILHAAALLAQSNDLALFIAGDLFDTDHPTPQMVTAAIGALNRLEQLILLVGNHDQSSASTHDHALGPFCIPSRRWSDVGVIEHPHSVLFGHGTVLCIPHAVVQSVATHIETCFAELPGSKDVFILHFGIADDATPAFLRNAPDAIHINDLLKIMRKYKVHYAYAGNWHHHQRWEFFEDGERYYITQCGALVPTGFDNPGMGYGKLIIHESGQPPQVRQIPGGPRFFTGSFEDFDLDEAADIAQEYSVYLQLKVNPGNIPAAMVALARLKGKIAGFQLLPNRAVVSAAARTAARFVRNTTSVDEAVAAYIKTIDLPNGADRAQVQALVKGYLSAT